MEEIILSNSIISREVAIAFFEELEIKVKKTFKIWGHKNFDDYVKNTDTKQKTQTKTKFLAGFYENTLCEILKENGYDVIESSTNGYDLIIDGVKYELKMTLSEDNSWTGNSYSKVKVDNFILIKISFDDDNNIEKAFFGILNAQNSAFKGDTTSGRAAFSTLQILKSDYDNFHVVFGSVEVPQRKNTKYLKIIKESYRD